jgi:mRNA interferase YafQ
MHCLPTFMRTIERTTAFKRDFKREAKGQHRDILDTDLRQIIMALVCDSPLEVRHRDHALSNNWKGYRDCHVKPDLVLIYRTSGEDLLILARLGSHSELGL